MNRKANSNKQGKRYYNHQCPRHHDLTILINHAKRDICNTCFATLKKSYFNVIAGMLLEQEYLHNVSRGLIEQNNHAQKVFTAHQDIISKLSAEITEIKNNGRNHEKPRPEPTNHTIPIPTPQDENQPPSDAQEICTEGHLAQVAHSLQDLLHIKIARVLDKWKKKRHTNAPKTDDLQHRKGTTHTHGGFFMP